MKWQSGTATQPSNSERNNIDPRVKVIMRWNSWRSQAHTNWEHVFLNASSRQERFLQLDAVLETCMHNIGSLGSDAVLNHEEKFRCGRNVYSENGVTIFWERKNLLATSLTWLTRRRFNLTPLRCEGRWVPKAESEFHGVVCAKGWCLEKRNAHNPNNLKFQRLTFRRTKCT